VAVSTVLDLDGPDNVFVNYVSGQGGASLAIGSFFPGARVTVGSPTAGVQNIAGPVNVFGSTDCFPTLTVDDSADTLARSGVQIGPAAVSGLTSPPGAITFSNLGGLVVKSGSGANAFTISGTSAPTTLVTGSGTDTVTVQATSVPLSIEGGGGFDYVTLGNAGTMQGLLGPVSISDSLGHTNLTLDDSADSGTRYPTIDSGSVTGLAPAPVRYAPDSIAGLTIKGGSGNNGWLFLDTPSTPALTVGTKLIAGAGNDGIQIQGTSLNSQLQVDVGGGTSNLVSLGDANSSVQGIFGLVSCSSSVSGGLFDLFIYDSGDTIPRNVSVVNFGVLNLAPAQIDWGAGLALVSVSGSTSTGSTYTIGGNLTASSHAIVTELSANGPDNITVGQVDGQGGASVYVGCYSPGVGVTIGSPTAGVQGINGAVQVVGFTNANSFPTLTVDDSADTVARSAVQVSPTAVSGLTLVPITYSNLGGLVVKGGAGADGFTVTGTPTNVPVGLDTGAGTNTVTVQSTAGPLTITGGAGSDVVTLGNNGTLQGLSGPVSVANPGGTTSLTLDDHLDTSPRTVSLDAGAVTGLAPVPIRYAQSDLSVLNVLGSAGGSTYNVYNTPSNPSRKINTYLKGGSRGDTVYVSATSGTDGASLFIDGNGGSDTVQLQDVTGTVQNVNGLVDVLDTGGQASLYVLDGSDAVPRSVTLRSYGIFGLTPGSIRFDPAALGLLLINAGPGGNTFDIQDTPGSQTTLNNFGPDQVLVQGTSGSGLVIDSLQGGDLVTVGDPVAGLQNVGGTVSLLADNGSRPALVVDDSADTVGQTATLTATALTGLGPAAINYAGLRSLTLQGGSGGNSFTVAGTSANSNTSLHTGTGNDSVTVQNVAAQSTLTVDTQDGSDFVAVGSSSAGGLTGIQGAVNLTQSVAGQADGTVFLTLNDTGHPGSSTTDNLTITSNVITGQLGNNLGSQPFNVSYANVAIGELTITAPTQFNQFDVAGVPGQAALTLSGSSSGNQIFVQGLSQGGLTIQDSGGDAVILGPGPGGAPGNFQGIHGNISINKPSGSTNLIVDDSADNGSESFTVTPMGLSVGTVSVDCSNGRVAFLSIQAGSGGNSYTISGTPALTTQLSTGTGNDAVDVTGLNHSLSVNGQAGSDTITLGNGLVGQNLGSASIALSNSRGSDTVIVNDQADFNSQTATLTDASVTLSSLGGLIDYSGVNAVAVKLLLGPGGTTTDVSGFTQSATLVGGSGVNTVIATNNDDFALGDHGLTRTSGGVPVGTFVLQNINQAILTCGTGNHVLNAAGFSGTVTLVGGTGNDTLTGGSGTNVLTGGPGKNTLIGGSDNTTAVESADDNFTLSDTLVTGTGSSKITDVLVNIPSARLTATSTVGRTLNASAFSGNVTLVGGTGNDTLTGALGNNTLSGGPGKNSLIGGKGTNTVSEGGSGAFTLANAGVTLKSGTTTTLTDTLTGFTQASLTGGPGNDTFTVSGWSHVASLNGGGGTDSVIAGGSTNFNLSDTSLTFGAAKVALQGIQQAQLTIPSGNHFINGSGFSGQETLQGGTGNDTLISGLGNDSLVGGSGNNVLLGGGGNDTLVAGNGRSLLLGGAGTDSLVGGKGDDILVAAATSFDSATAAGNFAAVNAIMAEWTSSTSYAARVAHLLGTTPGGKNGAIFLNSSTASTAGEQPFADTLTGGAGLDWFLAATIDDVIGQTGTTIRTNV
jgi:hypothetical protein